MLGRVDHHLRRNDLLTVRYYINNSGTDVSGSYGNPVADPLADHTDVRVQSLLAAHTHIFTPSLSNELRVTYLRRKFIDSRPGLGTDLAGTIGLTGVTDQAFPAFTIPGYAALSSATVSRFQTPIVDQQILDVAVVVHAASTRSSSARVPRRRQRRDPRSRLLGQPDVHAPDHEQPRRREHRATRWRRFLLGEVNAGSVQISDLIQTRALVRRVLRAGRLAGDRSPDAQLRRALGGRAAAA